ncbi:MAG: hypothetical protein D6820_13925 [Lentisphaerae bacterium]|nr:MAG: hypothetical protein D6820_13925 [Lentisphaerota bacterium]
MCATVEQRTQGEFSIGMHPAWLCWKLEGRTRRTSLSTPACKRQEGEMARRRPEKMRIIRECVAADSGLQIGVVVAVFSNTV